MSSMNVKDIPPKSERGDRASHDNIERDMNKILRYIEQEMSLDIGRGRVLDEEPAHFDYPSLKQSITSLFGQKIRSPRENCTLAQFYRLSGDLESSEKILKTAIEDTPGDFVLHHLLVMNLKDQERLLEAEAICLNALKLHPDSTTLLLDMAAVSAEKARLSEAAGYAFKATEVSPDSPVAWFVYANLLFLNKQFGTAGEAFRRASLLAPEVNLGPFMRGRALSLEYKDVEAVAAYKMALELCPLEQEKLSGVARHIRNRFTGDTSVRDSFAFYCSSDSQRDYILRHLAKAQILAGQLEEAVKTTDGIIRRAVLTSTSGPSQFPEGEAGYYLRALALFLQKKYCEAIPPLKRATVLKNKDFRLFFLLACCHWQLGEFDAAVEACCECLVWFSSSVPQAGNPAHLGALAETRVTLPWNMRMYQGAGMFHPLINELTQKSYDGFSLEYPPARQRVSDLRENCLKVLESYAKTRDWLESQCPDVSLGHIASFLESRHFLSQVLSFHPDHDFSVLHTAPYTLNQTPWLLHIEIPITLFYPYLTYGVSWHLDFENKPFYKLTKAYLESEYCLGIFSHVRSTCEALPRLFHNPKLAEKVYYFPLGAPALAASIAPKPSQSGAPVRILFTGSFNHDSGSFYSRGGLYVTEAFLTLADEFDDVELILRVNLPLTLDRQILRRVIHHPRIRIMTQWLSEHQLQELFDSSDIMALPTYALHCQSIFRAMASGCCCVLSDAPEYAQFAQHGKNCLIAGGRLGKVYALDSELGIIRENFPNLRAFDKEYSNNVIQTFRQLLTDRNLLRTLQGNASRFIEMEYPREKSVAVFEKLLHNARSRAKKFT